MKKVIFFFFMKHFPFDLFVILSEFDCVSGGCIWHGFTQMDIEEKRFRPKGFVESVFCSFGMSFGV